jgi:hypothetical protein
LYASYVVKLYITSSPFSSGKNKNLLCISVLYLYNKYYKTLFVLITVKNVREFNGKKLKRYVIFQARVYFLKKQKTSIAYKVKLTAPEPSLVGHVSNHQENAPPSRIISFFYPFFPCLIYCTFSLYTVTGRFGLANGWRGVEAAGNNAAATSDHQNHL